MKKFVIFVLIGMAGVASASSTAEVCENMNRQEGLLADTNSCLSMAARSGDSEAQAAVCVYQVVQNAGLEDALDMCDFNPVSGVFESRRSQDGK